MAFVACGLFVLGSLYYGTDARACTVESKARKIRKALARGNLTAACRAIKQFRRKYPLTPLPPDSPSDDDCANDAGTDSTGSGGRGRGGGMMGAGPNGGPIGGKIFIFNGGNPTSCFYYEILPDPGNPPGFSLPFPSGAVNVPNGTTTTVPLTVEVAPGVPDGTCAFFDVVITDCGNGDEIPGDYQRFKVTVVNGLQITIAQTNFAVVDGSNFSARWTVKNLTPNPVNVPYTFSMPIDPGSMPEKSDGSMVGIPDSFSEPRAAGGGGSVSLAAAGLPGDEEDIQWDMVPGEYCDPAMISCCALEIAGAVCEQCFVNVADVGARTCCPGSPFLIQGVSQGGSVDVVINGMQLPVPTPAGLTAEQVVDAIADTVAQHAHNTDNCKFAADPQLDEIVLARQGGMPAQLIRNDPGLFITDLPSYSAFSFFDVTPNDPFLRCDLPGADTFHVDIQIVALSLNSIQPITVSNDNVWQVSLPDVGGFDNLRGRDIPDGPIYNPGNPIIITIDYAVSTNLPTVNIAGPPQLDFDPLAANIPAFNVHTPVTLGGGFVDLDLFMEIVPTAFDGGNQVPLPINPGQVQAFPVGPNVLRVEYQSQAFAPLFAVQLSTLVSGAAINAPAICPFAKGDMNHDGGPSGMDVQGFVECLISLPASECPCADMDDSGGPIDEVDMMLFVESLL